MTLSRLLVAFTFLSPWALSHVESVKDNSGQLKDWLSDIPEKHQSVFVNFLSESFDPHSAPAEWSHLKNGRRIFHLKLPGDIEYSRDIGYAHYRNRTVYHAGRLKERILFYSRYDFNHKGFRVLLKQKPDGHQQHLILAGGSFVLGTSLNEEDTLASLVAERQKKYFPVNIGVAGSGPNTSLALLESRLDKGDLISDEGVFVYFYNEFHIERSNGFALERQWLESSPVYGSNESGELIKRGSFKEVQPWRTLLFSGVRRLLASLGLPYNFPRRSQKHILYTCHLLSQLKKVYRQKFPQGRFLIYDHPYSPMNPTMKNCLVQARVPLIESKIQWDKKVMQIPYDEHPNRLANEAVVTELLESLP